MGIIARWIQSRQKTRELKRISRILAAPVHTVQDLMEGGAASKIAERDLAALVLADPHLSLLAGHFNLGPDELVQIQRTLTYMGAGGWQRGHWVAASAMAFASPLAYVLFKTEGGRVTDRDTWLEVAARVDRYFEHGELGKIPLE